MSEPPVPTAIVRSGAPAVASEPTAPPPDGATVVPTYALYSRGQIGLVTFLTGPIAGGWMIAHNWKRLGEPRKHRTVLVGTILITGLLVAVALLVPSLPSSALPLAGLCAVFGLAAQQRYAFDDHVQRGGRRASNGRAAAVGLISVAIVLAVVFAGAIAVFYATQAPEVDIGGGHMVRYSAGATERDARAVGSALDHYSYFGHSGEGAAVGVRRDGTHHVVELVVIDRAFTDASLIPIYRELASYVSDNGFGGEPVDIWLVDDEWSPHKKLAWLAPHSQ